ncbi:MAG: carbonic anhydrase family protein, partial [Caldilineaceae bacterium]|nr:carbonic anhydrase family protein [Caldilineaceae bacterium]
MPPIGVIRGDTGPANWGSLNPEYVLCAEGTEQSPIGIPYDAASNPADLAFAYQPGALNIVNNGHAIQVNVDEGSTVEIDGQTYTLNQLHFHNPSEHTAAGRFQPLEMHLVHSNADGGLAVISVLVAEGAENPALVDIVANLPAEEGDPITIDGASVDASALLPADQSYWRYDGSLTTPPCSEGVKWFVMVNPITASMPSHNAIADLHRNNVRPFQP